MAKSIKLKDNNYIDSSGVVHNRKQLNGILNVIGESATIIRSIQQTFTNTTSTKILFDAAGKTGTSQSLLFSLQNNGIKIGAGISKVRVDLSVWSQSANDCYSSIHILKNSTQYTYEMAPPTNNANHRWRNQYSYAIIDVQENDIIYGYIRFSAANAIENVVMPYDNSTKLSVTVLK